MIPEFQVDRFSSKEFTTPKSDKLDPVQKGSSCVKALFLNDNMPSHAVASPRGTQAHCPAQQVILGIPHHQVVIQSLLFCSKSWAYLCNGSQSQYILKQYSNSKWHSSLALLPWFNIDALVLLHDQKQLIWLKTLAACIHVQQKELSFLDLMVWLAFPCVNVLLYVQLLSCIEQKPVLLGTHCFATVSHGSFSCMEVETPISPSRPEEFA